MILFIELVLEFFIAYKVYTEKKQVNAFLWYIAAMFLLFPQIIPFKECPYPGVVFAIVATIRLYVKQTFKEVWEAFPFKWFLLIILLFHILQSFTIPFQSWISTIRFELFYFLSTNYLLFVGFALAPSYREFVENREKVYAVIILLFLSGLISYIQNNNFIAVEVSRSFIWTSDRAMQSRGFRVTGTQASPALFGFICSILIVIINHIEKNLLRCYLMICSMLFCLFVCGTRTPMMCFVLMISLYYFFQSKKKLLQTLLLLIPILIALMPVLSSMSSIQNLLAGVTDLFMTGGENTDGSNMEMRTEQFEASWAYLIEKPIWGHGNNYMHNLLLETGKFHETKDVLLRGAEGYQFWLFVDYGAIYTVLILVFYISIVIYLFKFRDYSSSIFVLCLCIFSGFVFYQLSTRPDNTWQMALPLVGGLIGMFQFEKK